MQLKDVVFDAVDGESFTDSDGHHYALLIASCADTGWHGVWNSLQGNRKQLPTWVIFKALEQLSHAPNRIHVAFYFSYDVTKWVEDFSNEAKTELFHGKRVNWTSPYGRQYTVTYLPHKLFVLEYQNEHTDRRTSIKIYDVFGFFQASFVKTLKQWGFTKEIEFIEQMKAQRGKFTPENAQVIIEYSKMECDLLCQLMNKVRDALVSFGINMTKFYGAGSIAEAILDTYDMKKHIARPDWIDNTNFMLALLSSYFGGRFELFKQGIIKESHQYDINSAYPSAMATLPSFRDATVEYSTQYDAEAPYSIWHVTYILPTKEYPIGPLPFRTPNGNILFPLQNKFGVWVHQVELRAAMELYGYKYFKVNRGYIIRPLSEKRVYKFIPQLAKERLRLKAADDKRNIVLKLGLNSLYGKTAQGISTRGTLPPYQNFYIAGYITAYTRANLLRFSFNCGYRGSNVIQFATDGIFSTGLHSTQKDSSSSKLGEWEYTHIEKPTLYLKPGVYWVEREEGESARRKTRGFGKGEIKVFDVFKEWKLHGPRGNIVAEINRFIGIGTCIVNRDWTFYGRFIPRRLDIKFGPGPTKWYKYGHQDAYGRGEKGTVDSGPLYYLLEPYQRAVKEESWPYRPHTIDDLEDLDFYDDETRNNIKIELLYSEQPIYEKFVGFGEADAKE